jgi:hypothetical protein
MPRFIDTHTIGGMDEATLEQLQKSPKDEFGVTHVNIMYNKAENKTFCLLDEPNKETVEKHHAKAGLKSDWIEEEETTV